MTKNIFLILCLVCFTFITSYAQEIEVDEEIEEYEVDEEVEVVDYERSRNYSTRPVNPKYEYQILIDDYKLKYYRVNGGYQRVYGVTKGNRQLLPVVFTYSTMSRDKSKLILALGNKYGIYNFKTEKWDVPLSFTSLSYLTKDLYSANKGNRRGLIDSYGNIVVDFKWSYITSISGLDNYLIVRDFNTPTQKSGIFSVIGKELVVEPKYTSIQKLNSDNLFIVRNESNQYNIIDVKGKEQLKTWYDGLVAERGGRPRYIVTKNNRMGIIDASEKVIVPLTYRQIQTAPYSDGSYLAQNEDEKFGFMTIDGEVTLPFVYDNLEFQNYTGLGISSSDSKCGVVKVNNGKPYELATCDYDNITVSNNMFIIEQKGKYGLMDVYGKMSTEIVYSELSFLDNALFVAKQKGKYYIIDKNGRTINEVGYNAIEPLYTASTSSYYSSYSRSAFTYLKVTGANGKVGLMDKVGVELIKPQYDDILSEANNRIMISSNNKLGLYNLYTKKLEVPAEYDQLVFNNGMYYAFKGKGLYEITLGSEVSIRKID